MLNFLSPKIKEKIFSHDFKNILEIRARDNRKIVVTYYDKGIFKKELDYVIGKNDIENIILKLSNYSYASIENNLKMGFISSSEGERIGVAGECVVKDGKIVSIKNFSSLCIRFPNVIEGCSKTFFETNVIDCPKNCLIISPPFHGKTTFARDLGKQYSERLSINTLFIDERDEFSLGNSCDLGKYSDVIRYCDKKFGFYNGVRVMNPEVIVCDELSDESDFDGLNFAANSGVKVVATIHGDDLCDITKKEEGKRIIENKIFDYFVVLLNFKVYKIYDKNMRLL